MNHAIFDQAPEDVLFPVGRELGVAVIAPVPFEEGTLAGLPTLDSSWPEGDGRNTCFAPGNLKASVERAQALRCDVPPRRSMPEMGL